MKTARLITALLASALLARADVLPPSQDTSSLKGKLTAATGKATTLAVTATRKGFVLFDLNNLPADVQATDIANARLRVYFPAAKKPGDIALHTATVAWDEISAATEPGISASPIATFPAAVVVGKKFVEVDVTSTVQAWRAGTTTNSGFAFATSGLTNVLIGAKEGSGGGYPCELDIEIERATPDGSITTQQLADAAVTNAKLASATVSVTAGTGLTGGGSVALGGSLTLSLGSNLTLGGTTTGTFSGDGSGLTNLNLPAAFADGSVSNAKLANSALTVTAGSGLSGGGSVALGGSVTVFLDTNLTLGGTTAFSGTALLPAGTATLAPLRLQTGANLATPVFGAVEFDGTNLFLTNNSTSPTRKTLAFTDSAVSGSQLVSDLTLGGTTTGSFSGPLTGNVTGNVSGSAASFTGVLTGDVTGTQDATIIATVGNVSAADVATGTNLANAATTANTANTIVKRDASGNFAAGTITATSVGFASPVTRFLAIPAPAFVPGHIATNGWECNGVSVYLTGNSDANNPFLFFAPVTLPDGASISSMSVRVLDNSALADIEVSLVSVGSNDTPAVLASVGTSGVSAAVQTFNTPVTHVVDNLNRRYYLEASWSRSGFGVDLRNVRITYTITTPLP